jgi:hypothetical protein
MRSVEHTAHCLYVHHRASLYVRLHGVSIGAHQFLDNKIGPCPGTASFCCFCGPPDSKSPARYRHTHHQVPDECNLTAAALQIAKGEMEKEVVSRGTASPSPHHNLALYMPGPPEVQLLQQQEADQISSTVSATAGKQCTIEWPGQSRIPERTYGAHFCQFLGCI